MVPSASQLSMVRFDTDRMLAAASFVMGTYGTVMDFEVCFKVEYR